MPSSRVISSECRGCYARVPIRNRRGAAFNSSVAAIGTGGDTSTRLHSSVPSSSSNLKLPRLIEHGADVNARDAAGTPALMLAAQQGQTALVKLLLDRGADVQATDRDGQTILRSNRGAEHGPPVLSSDIRELLLKAGARE